MIARPSNHVTRALDAKLTSGRPDSPGPMPPVSDDFVRWLEANFPPRCKEPGEGLEAHLDYGGKVRLAETIRSNHELSKRSAADLMLDPDLDDNEIADVLFQRLDREQADLLARQLGDGGDQDGNPGDPGD